MGESEGNSGGPALVDIKDASKEPFNELEEYLSSLPGWQKQFIRWTEKIGLLVIGGYLGPGIRRLIEIVGGSVVEPMLSSSTVPLQFRLWLSLIGVVLLYKHDRGLNWTGGVSFGLATGSGLSLGSWSTAVGGLLGFGMGEFVYRRNHETRGTTASDEAKSTTDDLADSPPSLTVSKTPQEDHGPGADRGTRRGKGHDEILPLDTIERNPLRLDVVDEQRSTAGTSVTFRVTDDAGPVENATVLVNERRTITGPRGRCEFTFTEPDTYIVRARSDQQEHIIDVIEVAVTRPDEQPEYDVRAEADEWAKYPGDTYSLSVRDINEEKYRAGAEVGVPALGLAESTGEDGTCELHVPPDVQPGQYDLVVHAEREDGQPLESKSGQKITILGKKDPEPLERRDRENRQTYFSEGGAGLSLEWLFSRFRE